MFPGLGSFVTFFMYWGPGLSGRLRGKISRGTGRRPFVGAFRSGVGWSCWGISTNAGDSGGIYSLVEEVAKAREVDVKGVFTRSRSRQARQIERGTDSIIIVVIACRERSAVRLIHLLNIKTL